LLYIIVFEGEHTDYSGYCVLPMALNKHDTIFAVATKEVRTQQYDFFILALHVHTFHRPQERM